jgi:hypothetical protein
MAGHLPYLLLLLLVISLVAHVRQEPMRAPFSAFVVLKQEF